MRIFNFSFDQIKIYNNKFLKLYLFPRIPLHALEGEQDETFTREENFLYKFYVRI